MVNSAETRVSAEFTIQIGGRLFDRAACAIGAGSTRGFERKAAPPDIITFPSLPDCIQNQTAVSDKQHSLYDF